MTQPKTNRIPAPVYAAAGAGELALQQLRKLPTVVSDLGTRVVADLGGKAVVTGFELRQKATETLKTANLTATGLREKAVPADLDLDKLRDAATRNAAASLYGRAITWTPIGIAPVLRVGTATTGRPMKEIGWVNRPRLARTGSSTPPMVIVTWPSLGALHGVAGASTMSTSSNSFSTSARYCRRKRCAFTYQEPGSSVPAIRRSRVSGSKSCGRALSRGK